MRHSAPLYKLACMRDVILHGNMLHAASVAYTQMCRGCIRYAVIAAIYINRLIDAKDAADRRKERRILIQKEQAERAKQRDELKILQVSIHMRYNNNMH
jgi:hypothetical protein